ncbi:F-box only protein 39 [Frankliniella fusca]|uniref:F-box only protein 39 n=1 Tax=Frankliniella fusca TaxID=407009 RepID=A0AAE1H3R6_9NEOP|nr:F-box only protein 39 [Frankliniella fusca]
MTACRERLGAGLMCRRWLDALLAPRLWRSVRVQLQLRCGGGGGPPPPPGLGWDERAAGVVLASPRYAPLVRRLELRWGRPGPGPSPAAKASLAPALRLLEVARAAGLAGHLQLEQLQLRDLAHSHRACGGASQRGRLLAALATFLGSQSRLQMLSLENTCLGVSEVVRLLGAAARSSAAAITALRLRAAFREWQAPHASPRFCRSLRRVGPLASLSLDYPALSDAMLVLLGECCGPALRLLSVTVRDTDNRQHVLSEGAWADFARSCPGSRTYLNIENIGHHDDISRLLLPSMPLCGFRLYSGRVWDQSLSRAFRATLRLLAANYRQSLEIVQLNLKNSREQVDDVLLDLLTCCDRLSHFHFDGVLRRLSTVGDMCRLRLDDATNFQYIHVRPKLASSKITSCAKDILANFHVPLSEKSVDFQIEIPTR